MIFFFIMIGFLFGSRYILYYIKTNGLVRVFYAYTDVYYSIVYLCYTLHPFGANISNCFGLVVII